MATKTVVTLHSDLSGEVLGQGTGESLTFSLDGVDYEMDLTADEAAGLRTAIAPYIGAARRVAGWSATARRLRPAKPDLAKIRAWAEAHGYEVSLRGPLPRGVLKAFDEAHAV
ncbi:histone-like nucleoid-structuring protein Lsr2 [Sinomonas sp. P47F7]|uniref:histone-like nucleoid-structuring protein Lsr2 n=1 Tax=Sinomonas sp. P47F7 TaxID=3410987 RepID=UPI003BF4EEB8